MATVVIDETKADYEQAIDNLVDRAKDLARRFIAGTAKIDELERRLARALAEGDDQAAQRTSKQLVEARASQSALPAALALIEEQLDEPIRQADVAVAEAAFERAVEARRRAEEIRAAIEPHLEAIRAVDGVLWEPPMRYKSHDLGLSAPVAVPLPTKTSLLLGEAAAFESSGREKLRLAGRRPDSGQADGLTLDELVESIYMNPRLRRPGIADVVAWVKLTEKAARDRLAEWHRQHPAAAEEIQAERERFIRDRTAAVDQQHAGEIRNIEVRSYPSPAEKEEALEKARATRAGYLRQAEVLAAQWAPDAPAKPEVGLLFKLVWVKGQISPDSRAEPIDNVKEAV